MRTVLFVGTAAQLRRAAGLMSAHAAVRPVRTAVTRGGWSPRRGALDDIRAVILLADPQRAVGDVVMGTHVSVAGRSVPLGVMPDDPRAISAAAQVQRRGAAERAATGPIVLLSSREDHVRVRAQQIAERLRREGVALHELPSGRVDRRQLLPALAGGPGLVVYTGEGGVRGWSGYGRLQSWEFDTPGAVPMGAVISLSCHGSGRLGDIRGLSEVIVERGLAASALGAVTEVLRADDQLIGMLLAERLVAGAGCLADALSPSIDELAPFRISGDPLAPFIGAAGSSAALDRVDAPAVGDLLPAASWA